MTDEEFEKNMIKKIKNFVFKQFIPSLNIDKNFTNEELIECNNREKNYNLMKWKYKGYKLVDINPRGRSCIVALYIQDNKEIPAWLVQKRNIITCITRKFKMKWG